MERKVYEFISKQTNDPILERRTCAVSGKEFAIFQSDVNFLEKISPTFAEKKYLIPMPTLCPEERQRRRFSWRNESKLYKRKCDLTGKDMVSTFHKDHTFPVYSLEARFGDGRDATVYGQDFYFNKPFFQQFDELNQKAPKISLIYDNNENCDYTNGVGDSKNCYLIFGSTACEDCMYGSPYNSIKCVDSLVLRNCENCYECIDSNKLYNCMYCKDCSNSSNLEFCVGVSDCSDCFLCVGLVNQKYCIFNKQYDKPAYLEEVVTLKKTSAFDLMKKRNECETNFPKKSTIGYNNEHGIGNYLFNTKNCICSSDMGEVQDAKYSTYATDTKDIMDCDYGEHCNLLYENSGFFRINNVFFACMNRVATDNLLYCYMCYNNVHNCFGCIGLKNKQYCILNKQYTKAEYEKLIPQIIEHMTKLGERGEFFPIAISPCGYNETTAQEYYPITQKQAYNAGYKRMDKEYPINIPEGMQLIPANDLPSDIKNISDDILQKAIMCEVSGRPFRIIKQELEFYRKHNLPLPHKHPDIRHQERLAQRPPKELHLRTCDKCGIEMLSVYPQDSNFKVYCESCYNKEIYG